MTRSVGAETASAHSGSMFVFVEHPCESVVSMDLEVVESIRAGDRRRRRTPRRGTVGRAVGTVCVVDQLGATAGTTPGRTHRRSTSRRTGCPWPGLRSRQSCGPSSKRRVSERVPAYGAGMRIAPVSLQGTPRRAVVLGPVLAQSVIVRAISGSGGRPRFRMLETIRQYGQDRLLEPYQGSGIADVTGMNTFTGLQIAINRSAGTGRRSPRSPCWLRCRRSASPGPAAAGRVCRPASGGRRCSRRITRPGR